MLSNNHICRVQAQKFAMLEQQHIAGQLGRQSGCQLLMPLRGMLIADSELCNMYANEAYKVLRTSNKCTEDDYTARYEQMAMYGVLLSQLVYAVDIQTQKMALYTSSIGVLRELASRGILIGKKDDISVEINTLYKKMYSGDAIRKSFSSPDMKLVAVRLDVQQVGNNLRMTATYPRSAVSLATHGFVALNAVDVAMKSLFQALQTNMLRIRMLYDGEEKTRVCTMNRELLAGVYGAERAGLLTSYLPNIYTQRFYVPSVGASKYTLGVTNIDLIAVEGVTPATLADVDLSEVNTDYSMALVYFARKVNAMPPEQLKRLVDGFGIDSGKIPQASWRDSVITSAESLGLREVYDLMKANNDLFDLPGYASVPNEYGNEYTQVSIPRSVGEFRTLVSTGVWKAYLTTRNGKNSSLMFSNDERFLKKVYGQNYYAIESDGVRLRAFKRALEKGVDVAQAMKKFHVEGKFDTAEPQALKKQVEQQLYEIEQQKTVVRQPHLTLVRNVQAREQKDYYRYVDLLAIQQLIRLAK